MDLLKNQAHRETLVYAAYYAPRGRLRLYRVAGQLSQRYLSPTDLLIGVIGSEGSGKSTLIKGLFPGLELTNDDEGINIRPTPLYEFSPSDPFSGHTFHIDVRYELAFHQIHQVVEAVSNAISHGRRVVAEHFDLLYAALGHNAQVLIGIGEEILVARPGVFGPFPAHIKTIVDKTIRYRLMAHSAEDITTRILEKEYDYSRQVFHSDVKHGFIITFPERPDIDLNKLEAQVLEVIRRNVPIAPAGEEGIRIGEDTISCTGVRTHVKSSGEIENFRLFKDFKYDPISKEYLLVGMVGRKEPVGMDDLIDMSEFEQKGA
ncbi:MAG: lantibiotic ABC transporter [Elusimicrobia bacterium RIFOXYB2_FULL_49_7]|nr:MAG: lantibiotic ABC transporter [Elusimicrobia bacterium RIFOXYB2_FULL_49_7]